MHKKGNDFATEVDLAIERQVVEALESTTGIEVHGEEFGGADVDSPLVWVLDPIDGTFNYAAGCRRRRSCWLWCATASRWPGLTWLPFTDQRYTAVVGKPLYANGVAQPPLEQRQAGRLHRRHRHVQRRLPRPVSRPLPARRARAPEPEVLADADARRHRHRPRLHRGRHPRRGNQFRPPRLGPRGRRRAGAGGRRHRHRPGRQRLDDRVEFGAGRGCPACTASSSTSCGRSAIRRTTDGPQGPRGSRHPVPGRRRRPGGQGRQLRKPARRRRSRRARRRLRRARAPTS